MDAATDGNEMPLERTLPRLLLPAAILAATHDTFLQRWATGEDAISPALFVLAVVVWLSFVVRSRRDGLRPGAGWLAFCAALLGIYAAVLPHVPGLVSAELAAMALGCGMLSALPQNTRRHSLGLLCLLGLSVNLGPSLDFYAGYPLRAASGWLASLMLLRQVELAGTALSDGTVTVFIDSPCSGIRMLSAGLTLASVLALLLNLGYLRTLALGSIAVALTVFANAWRAAALFILERVHAGGWLHVFAGLAAFAAAAVLLAWIGFRLYRKTDATDTARPRGKDVTAAGHWACNAAWAAFAVALTAAVLAGNGFDSRVALAAAPAPDDVTWPSSWNGAPLRPLGREPGLASFLDRFPGAAAVFELGDGSGQVLLRRCNAATRALHPAEHCYRGTGWHIEPLPAWQDAEGRTWSRFAARKADGAARVVRQCYFSIDSNVTARDLKDWLAGRESWPDVSAWYWGAARPGSEVRATLGVTVMEK